MKALFIALVLLVFTRTGFGQGTILFSNRDIASGIDAPIYFFGEPLSGSAWYAQLYYAPPGSFSFVPAGDPLIFRTGTRAGYFDNTVDQNRNLAGILPGANVTIQIRFWQAEYGLSYEAANLVRQDGFRTQSIFVATGGAGSPPSLPGVLSGLGPTYLSRLPEPSTIALGLIGAGVLFLRRRQ